MDYGKLNIHVVSDNSGFPIPDATVQITSENEPESIIEEAVTNNVGQLNDIELTAPPVDYSMTPSANKPYSEYTITISASGFESVEINGAEIFSGETAIQNASLLLLPQAKPTVRNFLSFPTIHYGAITRQKYRKVKSKRWKEPEKLY